MLSAVSLEKNVLCATFTRRDLAPSPRGPHSQKPRRKRAESRTRALPLSPTFVLRQGITHVIWTVRLNSLYWDHTAAGFMVFLCLCVLYMESSGSTFLRGMLSTGLRLNAFDGIMRGLSMKRSSLRSGVTVANPAQGSDTGKSRIP